MADSKGAGGSILEHEDDAQKQAESAIAYAVNDYEAWKDVFELCLELRNFEISQLVQRNNFFMIFQGVLFAGICQSAGQIPLVSFIVCCVGLLVSMLQAGMACGSKYWQTHWEINTTMAEQFMVKLIEVHGRIDTKLRHDKVFIDPVYDARLRRRRILVHLFHDDSNRKRIKKNLKDSGRSIGRKLTNKLILQRYSISRIPIYVGIALAIGWAVLLLGTLNFSVITVDFSNLVQGFKKIN